MKHARGSLPMLALAASLGSPAAAQCPPGTALLVETHERPLHLSLSGHAPTAVELPAWDETQHPAGARLVRAELRVRLHVRAEVQVENTSPISSCDLEWTGFMFANHGGNAALELPPAQRLAQVGGIDQLDTYDGVLDYAGSSGESWLDQNDVVELPVFVETDPLELRDWIGSGPIAITHWQTGGLVAISPCGYLEVLSSGAAVLTFRVDYHWCGPELGSAYCFGDGSGTPCPCGNAGDSGRGCASSAAAGAALRAAGTPSASADDLVLDGAGLVPGETVLAFAGLERVAGGAGAPFGDGLRCAGGDVRRLGVELAGPDGSTRHGPGLVAAGGLAAGETRRFQLWYRDPAGPCAGGFNLSNGVELALAP